MLSSIKQRVVSVLDDDDDVIEPEESAQGRDTGTLVHTCHGCGAVYLSEDPHQCSTCGQLTVAASGSTESASD